MSRPKYREGDETARDRLESAFWDALAQEPYENLSVVKLCKAAGVNKNTFYYHFDNIDELARSAAESLVESQFIYNAIEAIKGNPQVLDSLPRSEVSAQLDRVCLLADDKAPSQLRCMLHDAVMSLWESEMGIDVEGIGLRGRASLEFVLGGFIGILAFRNREGSNFILKDVWGADYLPHAYAIIEKLSKTSQ